MLDSEYFAQAMQMSVYAILQRADYVRPPGVFLSGTQRAATNLVPFCIVPTDITLGLMPSD